jgi:hypothetical protein
MPTYVSILRIPQMVWVWRATVEWYTDRENRRTRRKTCPSATLPTKNPPGFTRARTRASAVRGRRLTTWAMARPTYYIYWKADYLHVTYPAVRRYPMLVSVDPAVMPHVEVCVRLLPSQGLLEPLVFVAGVVRHEVQNNFNICSHY